MLAGGAYLLLTGRAFMISASHPRLVIWYIGSVGSLVFLPFVATLLSDAGHSAAELAAMMIWMPIALSLGGPAASWLADRTGRADWVLKGATTLSFTASLAFLCTDDPLQQTLCLAALALGRAPFGPLGDALTLKRLGDDHQSYGQVRMWGSVTYLIAILIGGSLRPHLAIAPLLLGCGLMLFAVGFAWTLPPAKPTLAPSRKRILLPLLANPLIGLFLVISTLHGLSITTYDNFFALLVEQLGWPAWVTGLAIATGVLAEVMVLGLGRPLLRRLGPGLLILIGVASTLPRFWLMGTVDSIGWMIALQSLHGLGFGAFWIGGVAFLSDMAPKEAPNAAQSLLPASAFGAGYLASISLAAVAFQSMTLPALFQSIGLGSGFTIALCLLFLRQLNRTTAQL
jgi:MFS family permease